MAKRKSATLRKYFILPICFLMLEVVEAIATYKLEVVPNDFIRVALIIIFMTIGIAIVAFILVPFLEGGLQTLHDSSKKQYGYLGELAFIITVLIIIYWIFYVIEVRGPEGLLPYDLRN